jgi:multidrug efflux pump subunit AcrA (membrane-fusion protein)
MSSEPTKIPSRRRLALIGIAALAGAGALAASGIIGRAHSEAQVAQWTEQQVVPTVALAKLAQGDAHQTLTLPGSIQPFYKASIYARVNGYVKSWGKDIGAPVKAGDVLATIEAPDLDQQLAQAKATLASAKANSDIAAITANRNDILVKRQIVARLAEGHGAGRLAFSGDLAPLADPSAFAPRARSRPPRRAGIRNA